MHDSELPLNQCPSIDDLGDYYLLPLKRARPQPSIIAQNAVHSDWHVQQLCKAVDVAHANYYEQHPVQTCLTVVQLVAILRRLSQFRNVILELKIKIQKRLGTTKTSFYI